MQPKFAVNRPDLSRLDELGVADNHAMQRPVKFLLPECQEFNQDGKLRRDVVVLPDKGLQQARVIRDMIEDARSGEPIAGKLLYEIRRRSACSDPFGSGHYFNLHASALAKAAIEESAKISPQAPAPISATSEPFLHSIRINLIQSCTRGLRKPCAVSYFRQWLFSREPIPHPAARENHPSSEYRSHLLGRPPPPQEYFAVRQQ
jgi:hypothetical protein